MSEKKRSDHKTDQPKQIDRRKNASGIRSGGRRKDDESIGPLSKSSRIWFGLSLILTVLIIIWTFSVPFGSDRPIFAWDERAKPPKPVMVSEELKDHPEHLMNADEYVSYALEIEETLQDQLAIKNAVPKNLPDAKHAKKKLEERAKSARTLLEQLAKQQSKFKGGFSKGSIRALEMERIESKLQEKAH